jgi:hypothetical protein
MSPAFLENTKNAGKQQGQKTITQRLLRRLIPGQMTVAALRVCGFSVPLMATITHLARTELWCPRGAAPPRLQKAA